MIRSSEKAMRRLTSFLQEASQHPVSTRSLHASTALMQEQQKPKQTESWVNMWTEQFQTKQPFWHIDAVNKRLLQFEDRFIAKGEKHNFFVPLCGKSLDLTWLSQYGFVAGVEISQDAIDQFAAENKLTWDKDTLQKSDEKLYSAHSAATSNDIVIGKMDFFNLPDGWSDLGASKKHKFDRVWDRASLVAIEAPLREQYVEVIREQTSPNAIVLLSTFEYPEGAHPGPPYCVPESIVRELYEDYFTVELLMKRPIPMPHTEELVFCMKKR